MRARCRHSNPPHAGGSRREAGFSLVELLATLVVAGVVMAGAATLLHSTDRVSSSQLSIAELQTNHRAVQQELSKMIAMAGVGGLPESIPPSLAGGSAAGVFPDGLALAVRNNVAPDTHIGDGTTPRVVEGTDVLTVRGVFWTPVQFIDPQVPLTLVDDRISIVLQEDVDIGVAQDLEALRAVLTRATADGSPEAFIVRDRYNPGMFAVLELDPPNTLPGNPGDPTLTIGLILSGDAGAQEYANEYGRMILGTTLLQGAGGTQLTLPDHTVVQLPRLIGTIGLLEEHRFYVREQWEVRGDPTSRPVPVLARARFYPNTADLHPEDSIDLADGIVDLQLALGVDLAPRDGSVLDSGDQSDEILYNHPQDDDGLSPLATPGTWAAPGARMLFARLNIVAQAPHPDRGFEGVVLGAIEDHDHADPSNPSIFNTGPNPKVPKRYLQTIVKVRNLL